MDGQTDGRTVESQSTDCWMLTSSDQKGQKNLHYQHSRVLHKRFYCLRPKSEEAETARRRRRIKTNQNTLSKSKKRVLKKREQLKSEWLWERKRASLSSLTTKLAISDAAIEKNPKQRRTEKCQMVEKRQCCFDIWVFYFGCLGYLTA